MTKIPEYKTQRIKGTLYAYIDKPFWNSEKKRGEHKREYIGKVVDGEFVPNAKFLLKQAENKGTEEKEKETRGPKTTKKSVRQFAGATHVLEEISEKTGMKADLEEIFGKTLASAILSVAYYLVIEEGRPVYRFKKWANTHRHPFEGELSSQRISELFECVSEDRKQKYFKRQTERCKDREWLAFDTTSITSYSELLKQAKFGKNKEGDRLPQINLAILTGDTSMMPVCYRKLPGNTADVSTLMNLLKEIEYLDKKKVKLVMDRGFYSKANVNEMYKRHIKFLVGSKINLSYVQRELSVIRDDLVSFKCYDIHTGLYMKTVMTKWDYESVKKGEKVHEKRRIYLHFYYNDQKSTDEKIKLAKTLAQCDEELKSDKPVKSHQKFYDKYFRVSRTPKRGIKVEYLDENIKAATVDSGFFVLISNEISDPSRALEIYKERDLIEKSFGNLKERLGMRRMSVASEENFEGKLFVQFIALQLLSYIKKKMTDEKLFKNYTLISLLDELDIIERFHTPGKRPYYSEITEKQREIYKKLDIENPK